MKVLKVELTNEEISDVIDRAAHACRYWADYSQDAQVYDDAVVLHHEKGKVIVDAKAVYRGVCLALSEGERIPDGAVCWCDVPTVDRIVQYGVFAKLVYG